MLFLGGERENKEMADAVENLRKLGDYLSDDDINHAIETSTYLKSKDDNH